MRKLFKTITLALTALTARIQAEPAPVPPLAIGPYIQDGEFQPGDYVWLRGAFKGASAEQLAVNSEIASWRQKCREGDLKRARAELQTLGIIAGPSLDTMPYQTLICSQVSTLPEPLNRDDWSGFARDVSVVRPLVQGFLAALRLSKAPGFANNPDVRLALVARETYEQTLRGGLAWSSDQELSAGRLPSLTPGQRGLLSSQLAVALQKEDQENTAWLQRYVGQHGWPPDCRNLEQEAIEIRSGSSSSPSE